MSHPPSDHGPRHGGDRPQRRMPPPDSTGAEAEYLLHLKDTRTPIVVDMLDGTEFSGVLEYYDRDMLKVNRPEGGGPNVFIRKKHVRSIREEGASAPESPASPPR